MWTYSSSTYATRPIFLILLTTEWTSPIILTYPLILEPAVRSTKEKDQRHPEHLKAGPGHYYLSVCGQSGKNWVILPRRAGMGGVKHPGRSYSKGWGYYFAQNREYCAHKLFHLKLDYLTRGASRRSTAFRESLWQSSVSCCRHISLTDDLNPSYIPSLKTKN